MDATGKQTRVLIAEDEAPARRRLRKALEEFPGLYVVAEAEDGTRAVELIREYKPDILFLDVQMPMLDGLSVLDRVTHKPQVIFTTAYDRYAIQAFEVHAVDYLLKPYSRARLTEAIERALHRIESGKHESATTVKEILRTAPVTSHLKRISYRTGSGYGVVAVTDVVCFKAREGLIFATGDREERVVDIPLSRLEKELDPVRFFRIHRHAIINLGRITRVTPREHGQLEVILTNGDVFTVSRRRSNMFRRRIGFRQ